MCPMNCHPTFCGMLVDVSDEGRLLRVRGDQDNPDSRGWVWTRRFNPSRTSRKSASYSAAR